MADNENFDSKNLGSETVNIQTLITFTIMKNPKIIEVFQQITQQDANILEKKTNNFFNITLKIDEITLIIYLCALMYENDIIPNYINLILEKLNMKIDINDLKNTANNFINFLNNKNNNLVGGSKFNFDSIKNILLNIAACLFISSVLYIDYTYYTQNIVPSTERVIGLVSDFKQKLERVTKSDTLCNAYASDYVLYIDKYGFKGFSELYKLSSCLATSPENNPFFDDFIMEYNSKSEDLAIQNQYALVPLESSNSEMSKQVVLVQFNNDIQIYNDFTNTIYNKQISSKEDLDKYIVDIKNLINIPHDELVKQLTNSKKQNTINVDENVVDEKSFLSTFKKGYNFISDTGKVIGSIYRDIVDSGGVVPAINPLDQYVRTIQFYLTSKLRELEDLKRKSERQFEDYTTEINYVIKDVFAVTYMIGIFTFINLIVSGLLKYYFFSIYTKLSNIKLTEGTQLQLEDKQLQLEDKQLQLEDKQLQLEDKQLQLEDKQLQTDEQAKGGNSTTRRKRRKTMKRKKTIKRKKQIKRKKTIKRKKQIKRKKSIKK